MRKRTGAAAGPLEAANEPTSGLDRPPRRRAANALSDWEVALVKAMILRGGVNDQVILAYFTRPTRSVNHRVISEIRTDRKLHYRGIQPASDSELDSFLLAWPEVDDETGLALRGDELLIKSREAMIAAVHIFNGAGLTFRTELFIVTSVIAWTYLLHAWFCREGVDYRYRNPDGTVAKTKEGADRHWELRQCLERIRSMAAGKRPVSDAADANLRYLLDLRHEIEHRMTSRIDEAVSAKLQACCINFNEVLKKEFGGQQGLERRLPIALQFVTYGTDQRELLKRAQDLPPHIAAMMSGFDNGLSPELIADPAYAYRVLFVPITAKRAGAADQTIEFVKAGSAEGQEMQQVFLKEVNKRTYAPGQIVRMMKDEGFVRFSIQKHTDLWRALGARDESTGFCKPGVYGNWEWFDSWVARVRAHCQENAERYRV